MYLKTRYARNAVSRSLVVAVLIVIIVVAATAVYVYYQQPQPTTAKYVTIGLSIPTRFAVGQDAQAAADMAVSEINSKGGVVMNGTQYLLRTVTEDTNEMDWTIPVDQGLSALDKLVSVDGAQIILGGVRTDVVVAQTAKLPQYKVVFVDVESNQPISECMVRSAPKCPPTVKANYTAYKYYFHLFVNGTAIGPSLVQFPVALRSYAKTQQGWPNVVYKELIPLDTQDFSTYLSQIAASKAGLIVLFFSGTDGVSFAQQWRSYNWPNNTRPFVYGPGLLGGFSYFWDQSNGAAQGMVPWPSTVNQSFTPKTVPFINAFTKKYGHTPNTMALDMYDAVYVVKQAMEMANSWKADKLIPALESLTYTGVIGTIHFTSQHGINLPQIPMYQQFGQWQNGVLVPIWKTGQQNISSSIIKP